MTSLEVYADIWCPFTHVGLRAFAAQRRAAGRTDVVLRVRPWPLELVNGAPMDVDSAMAHIEDLRTQVAPGLFARVVRDRFPSSTLEALALVEHAYVIDSGTGERLSFALRDALFEEGLDISDPSVLRRIATTLGVGSADDADRRAVVDSWHRGVDRGVLGSPHFFCGDRDIFCPTLEISHGPGHGASIRRDTTRLAEFLDSCLVDAPG